MESRPRFEPETVAQWRTWLQENHKSAAAVWLVYRKKASSQGVNLSYAEALDEALCFGWIDSKVKSINAERYEQYYAPRKPTSVWSQINKKKVADLIASGRMQAAGLAVIERAKENGSWAVLDGALSDTVPDDLAKALTDAAKRHLFDALTPSARRLMLEGIVSVKRPETRLKRIAVAVDRLAEKPKAAKRRRGSADD